jgi:hypothetical protein
MAGKQAGPHAHGEAKALVRLFRVQTEEQFDFWITALNRAAAAAGGKVTEFTRDDRQKTISYWYLLMFLLELYAADRNPFTVRKGETGLSDPLLSMHQLGREFRDRYKAETIRRYVFDLKACGLIALEGRGGEAKLRLAAPAIKALADTIRQWVDTFRDVDRRVRTMQII